MRGSEEANRETDSDAPVGLEQLLERLEERANQQDRVSMGAMLEAVGPRSFAPLLLLAGLIMFSPLSGIMGVSTMAAMLVLLTAGQLLLGRRYFWLPAWLQRRSISHSRFNTLLRFARPPARAVDRLLKPRLTIIFVRGAGTYLIALLCVLIAFSIPPMEVVPFLATTAGAILTVLAMALIAHDGLVVLFAVSLIALALVSILVTLI